MQEASDSNLREDYKSQMHCSFVFTSLRLWMRRLITISGKKMDLHQAVINWPQVLEEKNEYEIYAE
jgi:hypothetical protein